MQVLYLRHGRRESEQLISSSNINYSLSSYATTYDEKKQADIPLMLMRGVECEREQAIGPPDARFPVSADQRRLALPDTRG